MLLAKLEVNENEALCEVNETEEAGNKLEEVLGKVVAEALDTEAGMVVD